MDFYSRNNETGIDPVERNELTFPDYTIPLILARAANQCNCADVDEVCDNVTGACPISGCRDGPPLGTKWSGPGCRIGKINLLNQLYQNDQKETAMIQFVNYNLFSSLLCV